MGGEKIRGFRVQHSISNGDCSQILTILKKKPIAVAISASFDMAFYSEGTFSGNGYVLNHGVVLVGYHYNHGFFIKNSWGIYWGYGGYGWVDLDNNTGICEYAVNLITTYEARSNSPHHCPVCDD